MDGIDGRPSEGVTEQDISDFLENMPEDTGGDYGWTDEGFIDDISEKWRDAFHGLDNEGQSDFLGWAREAAEQGMSDEALNGMLEGCQGSDLPSCMGLYAWLDSRDEEDNAEEEPDDGAMEFMNPVGADPCDSPFVYC